MPRQIFEYEIPELQQSYGSIPHDRNNRVLEQLVHTNHPEFGSFKISNVAFPSLHVLEMNWSIPQDLTVHETHPSETVDINFVLEGGIHGQFSGLGANFGLNAGTNNLKFTPTEKSSHRASQQDATMFVISLEKDYFRNLIGYDNHWAEEIQRKMDSGESFLASDQFLKTTPRMQALIHSIRTMEASPTSRLGMHSMAFDLIAQQVDQLIALADDCTVITHVSVTDQEKLHNLKLFIDRHFLEDLSLASLSREALLNEFKLKKGFKALFGTSVITYVRQLRMEYAQTLLRNSKVTVEEVAAQLGYTYPNHFSVAYKKHFGVAPSVR